VEYGRFEVLKLFTKWGEGFEHNYNHL